MHVWQSVAQGRRGTTKTAQLHEQNIRIMGTKFVYNISPRIFLSGGSSIIKLCQQVQQKTHLEQVDGSCYSIFVRPSNLADCLLTNFLLSAFTVCVREWHTALLKPQLILHSVPVFLDLSYLAFGDQITFKNYVFIRKHVDIDPYKVNLI
jgi:hypothetical protein